MSTARTVVVDDDPVVTRLLQRRLEAVDIACDVASSAEEALGLMQANLYFVVIADIHMPGMSGVEMISALKEINPLVQVVMLTVDACMEQVIACADRSAVDFFKKDADHDRLVETVKNVLKRRDRWAAWMGGRHGAVAVSGEPRE